MKWVGIVIAVVIGVPLVIGLLSDLAHGGVPAAVVLLAGLVAWLWIERTRRQALAQRLERAEKGAAAQAADLQALGERLAALDARVAHLARAGWPAGAPVPAEPAAVPAADGAEAGAASSASASASAAESVAAPAPVPAALATADLPAAAASVVSPAPVPMPAPEPAPRRPTSPSPDDAPAFTLPEPDERSLAVTSTLGASVLAWFRGGNTIVRVAVLILFIGVAFLLRYAAEHSLVPLELRLAAVAAGGAVLLGLGWRLRARRRGYGLTLQGAGLGVLYMTVFAAMKLYDLLPLGPGFALLVAIALLGAAIAVLQDALPLAVVGFLGGFAAPLLASTGAGNHVALFGYCLVLNLAIAVIASRRAWKLLNAVGFTCTSAIAAAWGASAWQPVLLASTEPFLIAHVALYLWISVQYSLQLARASSTPPPQPAWAQVRGVAVVDAGLVFGLPLVAMGFQAVLVREVPYALAASAAVMSAVYLLLGRWLWRRQGEGMRLYTEAMLAIGTVFLALIAPLALDERWTAPAWALQGVGLVWVALRQRRAWAMVFGLLLQVGAAWAYLAQAEAPPPRFMLHAGFLAALLLAAAALLSAALLQRAADASAAADAADAPDAAARAAAPPGHARWVDALFAPGVLAALHWGALVTGVLHLVLAGLREAPQAPWRWPDAAQLVVLWLVLLAAGLEAAHRRLHWPALSVPARPLLGLAGLLALADLAVAVVFGGAWAALVPTGGLVLLAVAGVAAWVLRRLDRDSDAAGQAAALRRTGASALASDSAGPAAPAWLRRAWAGEGVALGGFVLVAVGLATDVLVKRAVAESEGWRAGASMAAPTLVAWAVLAGLARQRWPTDRHAGAWLAGLALPWLALLLAWSAGFNLVGDGAMAPLPYLPFVNPIDLGHGLLLLYALRLRRALAEGTGLPLAGLPLASLVHRSGAPLAALTAAMAFWWLTSLLVRSLHHWADTPMWLDGALDAGLVQMALSILWTTIALGTMVVAARRLGPAHARTVWLAGAGLLGVVVAKLLLVDLSQTSALQRIGSFVGVGLLMLVVGYVAPLPPARAAGTSGLKKVGG